MLQNKALANFLLEKVKDFFDCPSLFPPITKIKKSDDFPYSIILAHNDMGQKRAILVTHRKIGRGGCGVAKIGFTMKLLGKIVEIWLQPVVVKSTYLIASEGVFNEPLPQLAVHDSGRTSPHSITTDTSRSSGASSPVLSISSEKITVNESIEPEEVTTRNVFNETFALPQQDSDPTQPFHALAHSEQYGKKEYLVMPLLPLDLDTCLFGGYNPTKTHAMKPLQQFNMLDILAIAINITQAVQCLHAQGLGHGDLKPQNMITTKTRNTKGQTFIRNDLNTKIIDLDTVRKDIIEINLPRDCRGFGTERYLAHEIDELDPSSFIAPFKLSLCKADVFSLGIMFYEMFFDVYEEDHLFKSLDKISPIFYADIPPTLNELHQKLIENKLYSYWNTHMPKQKLILFKIVHLITVMTNPKPEYRWTIESILQYLNELYLNAFSPADNSLHSSEFLETEWKSPSSNSLIYVNQKGESVLF
jgi:hypothetical protein